MNSSKSSFLLILGLHGVLFGIINVGRVLSDEKRMARFQIAADGYLERFSRFLHIKPNKNVFLDSEFAENQKAYQKSLNDKFAAEQEKQNKEQEALNAKDRSKALSAWFGPEQIAQPPKIQHSESHALSDHFETEKNANEAPVVSYRSKASYWDEGFEDGNAVKAEGKRGHIPTASRPVSHGNHGASGILHEQQKGHYHITEYSNGMVNIHITNSQHSKLSVTIFEFLRNQFSGQKTQDISVCVKPSGHISGFAKLADEHNKETNISFSGQIAINKITEHNGRSVLLFGSTGSGDHGYKLTNQVCFPFFEDAVEVQNPAGNQELLRPVLNF